MPGLPPRQGLSGHVRSLRGPLLCPDTAWSRSKTQALGCVLSPRVRRALSLPGCRWWHFGWVYFLKILFKFN